MNHKEFRLGQMDVSFHSGEAISANSKLKVLEDQEIIAAYFRRHISAYQDELDTLLLHQRDTKVKDFYIVIPSRGEADIGNLEKTLSLYSNVANIEKCKIVLFENHPQQEQRDLAATVVQRITARYPQLDIVQLYKVFPEPPTISMVRKLATDFVLLQKHRSGRRKGVIIVSHDADAEFIPKDYIRQLQVIFRNKRTDAVGGGYEYSNDVYERIPILKPLTSLPKEFRKLIRGAMASKGEFYAANTVGANSAFRSGIYAAIGGYDPDLKGGEDTDLGRRMFSARKKREGTVISSDEITIITNARRSIRAILDKIPFNHRHHDFHRNPAMRKDRRFVANSIRIPMDVEELEKGFQSTYDVLLSEKKIGILGQEAYDRLFVIAAQNIGYDCAIRDGKVTLTGLLTTL